MEKKNNNKLKKVTCVVGLNPIQFLRCILNRVRKIPPEEIKKKKAQRFNGCESVSWIAIKHINTHQQFKMMSQHSILPRRKEKHPQST